ncbi:MAG: hypothetical protein ACRC7O_06130 [Fimbriiglobus sp.]
MADDKDVIKPYTFHGLDVTGESGKETVATCPFCGKEGKFYLDAAADKWSCKVCGTGSAKGGGNLTTFLRNLRLPLPDSRLLSLAADRRAAKPAALMGWGLGVSAGDGGVCLEAGPKPKDVQNVYRWAGPAGKRAFYGTPGRKHGLLGLESWDPKKDTVYVCEGLWDGVVLREVLKATKCDDDEATVPTAAEANSLYRLANVVAVPSCSAWDPAWCPLFAGKDVVVLFDSDRPGENGAEPAGYAGMRRATAALTLPPPGERPASVSYLAWGPNGYDPGVKAGYDVRDLLTGDGKDPLPLAARAARLGLLFSKVRPVPDEWVRGKAKGGKPGAVGNGSTDPDPLPCTSWKELERAWKKAMKFTEGLDRALSVMLASIVSVPLPGDQLWVKVVSPAATGKSSLCEALAVSKKYVICKSTVRGFHSGYRETNDPTEDNSLVAVVKGKTLVTKDGDTLLQSPNLDQILSEARDVYDRVSNTHYRNKASKNYSGIDMTWILCGTGSLRALDNSELGQRFLDCVIMDGVDPDHERDIVHRSVNTTRAALKNYSGAAEDSESEAKRTAKRLTGGYIDHLRETAADRVCKVDLSDEQAEVIERLGVYVSYMRARPSSKQSETVEREMGTRLASQLTRLAVCLCVVLDRPAADAEVMRRVRRTALDTARGVTSVLAGHMYAAGEAGVEQKQLVVLSSSTDDEVRRLLTFLRKIGAVDSFQAQAKNPPGDGPAFRAVGGRRYRLTPRMTELWELANGPNE